MSNFNKIIPTYPNIQRYMEYEHIVSATEVENANEYWIFYLRRTGKSQGICFSRSKYTLKEAEDLIKRLFPGCSAILIS